MDSGIITRNRGIVNMIKNEFLIIYGKEVYMYKNNFVFNDLKPSLQKAFLKLVLNCPSEGSSHLAKDFKSLGILSRLEFEREIIELQDILNTKSSNYISRATLIDEQWFERFNECFKKNKPFVYIRKEANHLDTLYKKIRNSIAHGRFFIHDNFITMWNVSSQDNITALLNIRLSSLKKIADRL